MRRDFLIGLAVLLFALVCRIEAKNGDESETQRTNRQLVDVDDQGHENTSGRNVRQFGFGYPPPFGFGGPGYGGSGFGGPGFGGPGFGGPGFGGGYGGGYGRGYGGGVRVRERYRVRERVVTRTRHNGFGGGFYG